MCPLGCASPLSWPGFCCSGAGPVAVSPFPVSPSSMAPARCGVLHDGSAHATSNCCSFERKCSVLRKKLWLLHQKIQVETASLQAHSSRRNHEKSYHGRHFGTKQQILAVCLLLLGHGHTLVIALHTQPTDSQSCHEHFACTYMSLNIITYNYVTKTFTANSFYFVTYDCLM